MEQNGNTEKLQIAKNLRENEIYLQERFQQCADIILRPMRLGGERKTDVLMLYIEVAVSNMILDETVLGKMLNYLWESSPLQLQDFIRQNSSGIADAKKLRTMEEAIQGVFAGDVVLFLDGFEEALKISSKGYPAIGVSKAESEKVLRGSREGFTDSVKTNSALIRKRLRDTRLKILELTVGTRSHTLVHIVYMEDLADEKLLENIREKIEQIEIDGLLNNGMLEQLLEAPWYSPFPRYLSTERPDRAAAEILEGKVVLLCDQSPEALVLPGNINSFFESSEDWNHHFVNISFLRILRYTGMLLAVLLPGLYLAAVRFHTQILPTNLLLSFAEAREGVPFSSVMEVFLLELAFELIREAGVRVPGALGNAIGIVGGLIIGDAAVSANLVSPITVVIVALTALGAMAVPNEEFASAFRIIKYIFLLLGGFLGIYGIVLGIYIQTGHLSGLLSFGMPYLMPFVKKEKAYGSGDGILRLPARKRKFRSVYAKKDQKVRLKFSEKKKQEEVSS